MTRKDFTQIVGPLALQFKCEMDHSQWRLLHEALEDVPPSLLALAVKRAAKTRKWFPKPVEFLEDAEACRTELREALKFLPCAQCSAEGWVEREIDGVRRMVRCECWKAHQSRVAALGVGDRPLALQAARGGDWTATGDTE